MQLNGYGVIRWRYPMLGAPRGSPGGPQGPLGASGALKVAPRGAGGQKKAKKKLFFYMKC